MGLPDWDSLPTVRMTRQDGKSGLVMEKVVPLTGAYQMLARHVCLSCGLGTGQFDNDSSTLRCARANTS